MTAGLAALIVAYGLSQFYRAFLAVLAPTLEAEIGTGAGELALASGLWFIAFAAIQLPIGWVLDRYGPRLVTVGLMLGGAAGGALVFASAQTPWQLYVAMTMIGFGCAPIMMASYYILARFWPAQRFSAMAGIVVGGGSIGNILGTAPLVAAIEAFGWRATLVGLAGLTIAVAGVIALLVRAPAEQQKVEHKGSVLDVLRIPALWAILPLILFNYAAAAAVQGVWAAPLLANVYGAGHTLIGIGTLIMGLAMVGGNLSLGWLVRKTGSPRRVVLGLTPLAMIALFTLAWRPDIGLYPVLVLLAILGLAEAGFPLLISDGRQFLPTHLLGRGMTFLNMFTIMGVGIVQFASRPIYHRALVDSTPTEAISDVFLLIAIPLTIAYIIYLTLGRHADQQS